MADESHRELFERYVADLEWAVSEANALRRQDFENLEARFRGDRARAQEAFEALGPLCADPYVIGAVRQYWLACDERNRAHPETAIEPQVFILEWLRPERPDLATVLEEYPYWPVGLDNNGRWI